MLNDDAQEFIRSLRACLNAEIANCKQPDKSSAFAKMLDEVADTLKKQGCDERQVQAALLALCGVPIRPLSFLP